jgi:hypothetical protein
MDFNKSLKKTKNLYMTNKYFVTRGKKTLHADAEPSVCSASGAAFSRAALICFSSFPSRQNKTTIRCNSPVF